MWCIYLHLIICYTRPISILLIQSKWSLSYIIAEKYRIKTNVIEKTRAWHNKEKKEFREQRIVIKEFHTNRWQLTEKNQWSSVEGNIYYEKWKIVIVNCISKPHVDAKEGMERARIKLFFLYQASKNSSQLQAVNYFCKSFIIKINNRHTKKCDTCLKVTIKTPERRHWRRSGVFIVNFEHISHLFSVFLLLTLNK